MWWNWPGSCVGVDPKEFKDLWAELCPVLWAIEAVALFKAEGAHTQITQPCVDLLICILFSSNCRRNAAADEQMFFFFFFF